MVNMMRLPADTVQARKAARGIRLSQTAEQATEQLRKERRAARGAVPFTALFSRPDA